MKKRIAVLLVAAAASAGLASTGTAHAAGQWKDADAIAALSFDGKSCSGAIVKLKDSKPTDKALLLSAGHCIPGPHLKTGESVANKKISGTGNRVQIHKGADKDNHLNPLQTHVTDVVYATMTGTDVSLMKIDKTYAALQLAGIKAREIPGDDLKKGDAVSVPAPGIGQSFHGCKIENTGLTKKVNSWTWNNFVEVSGQQCEQLREGASGSPIISDSDGRIRGIVSMVGDGPGKRVHGFGAQTSALLGCVKDGSYSANTCKLHPAGK
ncbi:trypsin-like peptidase domain-containing protein [Dermatophilus congolensis]|uniref:Uncharacterized protein n=1 Tax=Dermatophilus congolensis TaxID=1863 RepID=A0A239VUW6_9MICO|nr:trypsin-like peptidase domain-containing protein [Dermatophilus congolensis]MBO3130024.1 trypsin-like peptidase domain-containing protein [Dermatophilus congolensis]MBO3131346.1 trypsin-like peptidase domain-containing protein [Dermatophilus congolensis]MBO3134498.1 trypsin-like peptidase domain-containing protein [Dermatophilus congolensis]MBO3136733.1 trypsin-like peptidase domain-containing protein [Dermatophilus congolensis]MBO3138978.1 trypsin-like peptidase domain-containing protein [